MLAETKMLWYITDAVAAVLNIQKKSFSLSGKIKVILWHLDIKNAIKQNIRSSIQQSKFGINRPKWRLNRPKEQSRVLLIVFTVFFLFVM